MSEEKNTEWFPVVDEEGNTTGIAPRHVCHDGKSFLLHPVVHLHVFNSNGEIYLQKRSSSKDVQPGKWDTSVGGHIAPEENVIDALRREAREELGIEVENQVFQGRYVWQSKVERELVSSFYIITDVTPEVNPEEIDEGKYWTREEIKENTGKNIFTPNFEHEFNVFLYKTDKLWMKL